MHQQILRGYLEIFILSIYYCGQLPFRVKRKSETIIIIQESIFHRVLSGILSLLGLSVVIKEIYALAQFNLYSNPEIFFKILSQVGRSIFHLWWIYAFQTKQTDLKKLLDETSQHTIYSKWHNLKCSVFPGIVLTLNFIVAYFYGVTLIRPLFSHTNSYGWWSNVFQIMTVLGFFLSFILQTSFTTLVLVLAFSAYETEIVHINLAKSFIAEGHNLLEQHEMFAKMALNLKNYFVVLNRFGRGFFLAWFFTIVPWMAYHLVENLPGMKQLFPGRLIYNWTFITFYGVILMFCAEARKQVEGFQKTIFQVLCRNDPLSPANQECMRSVAYFLKDSGMKGGYFFTFSYQFLGSTFGLVVTYAFLYLQFNSL